MATKIKKSFKQGIWIKEWKFRSDKIPFKGKTTPAAILSTRHKIEKFVLKNLKDRKKWQVIGEQFSSLIFHPAWKVTTRSGGVMVFHLTVKIFDPKGPPRDSVVAPPPPKQPPPPNPF